jgi:sialic acid synthase SpsE
MVSMAAIFDDAVIGFSDHTSGIGASPYAVAMGAKIVEKHFTLAKTMEGPDHRASLDPDELKTWVQEIRHVEQMLGDSRLSPAHSEKETKKSLQKSVVSKAVIKAGEIVTRENVTTIRTGGIGIPASMTYEILGKKSRIRIEKNTVLHWNQLAE